MNPLLSYVDDYIGATPMMLLQTASELFEWFNNIIGFRLKSSKNVFGQTVIFLGIEISVLRSGVVVMISEKRRIGLKTLIDFVLKDRSLSGTDAESLVGRLSFA